MRKRPTVYLIHLDSPISGRASHYLGFSNYVQLRFAHHKAGNGARFLQIANERGIDYRIVRTWPGDRSLERQLKRRKNRRFSVQFAILKNVRKNAKNSLSRNEVSALET